MVHRPLSFADTLMRKLGFQAYPCMMNVNTDLAERFDQDKWQPKLQGVV